MDIKQNTLEQIKSKNVSPLPPSLQNDLTIECLQFTTLFFTIVVIWLARIPIGVIQSRTVGPSAKSKVTLAQSLCHCIVPSTNAFMVDLATQTPCLVEISSHSPAEPF